MKKRKKSKGLAPATFNNPVAKYAHQFNKAQVLKDKSKYQRHNKHKAKEPFPMVLLNIIGKGSCHFIYSA